MADEHTPYYRALVPVMSCAGTTVKKHVHVCNCLDYIKNTDNLQFIKNEYYPDRGVKVLSSLFRIHTCPGAHAASFKISTGAFSRVKTAERRSPTPCFQRALAANM